jgi:hypothetical protein
MVVPFSKSITTYKSFLATSKKRFSNTILLLGQKIGSNPDLIDAPQTDIAQAL